MYHKKLTAALAIAVLGGASGVALADKPGADWITLEQAVEKAKAAGYTTLHSIDADNDSWEGEGVKADGKVWEFRMDGKTGEMTRDEQD
ncbi:MAG TPA: PepSY domain-containing protein [Pseudomonas sp.]|nr:PepSY domain-containing protein [Pseudomonas sp.]